MLKLIYFFLGLSTVPFMSSCRTVSHKVTERSKKELPRWASDSRSNQFTSNKSGYRIVFFKEDIKDIALGIRQGQQQALSYAYMKIYNEILSHAIEGVEKLTVDDRKALQLTGLKVVEKVFNGVDIVKDVYFEKVHFSRGSNKPDSYQIYILCNVEKKIVELASKQIKFNLVNSTSPRLKLLGSRFNKQIQ